VPVIKSLKKKHIHKADTRLNNDQKIEVDCKDETDKIIDTVLSKAVVKKSGSSSAKQLPVKEAMAASWI
jgi:hypothetical protein